MPFAPKKTSKYLNKRARLRSLSQKQTLGRLLLWSTPIAIVLIFGLVQFDGQTLWTQIQQFSWLAIALSLGAVLCQIFFQTARLWLLFPKHAKLPWQTAAIAFIRGQFISNWVNTQAGYAVKIWHIRPREKEQSRLSLVLITAIVFLDKLLDIALLALLSIAAGIWLLQGNTPSGVRGYAAFNRRLEDFIASLTSHPFLAIITALGLVASIGMVGWLLSHPSRKVQHIRQQLKDALGFLRSPSQTLQASLMGVGDWLFEMLSLQVLCHSAGFDLDFAQASLCLLILNLGISVPSGIANVGAFEASLTFALTRFGLPWEQSIAIAVLYHALQLTGITLWYFLSSLMQQNLLLKQIPRPIKKI